jgi:hypothetical protein
MFQRVSRAADTGEHAAHRAAGTAGLERRRPADVSPDLDLDAVLAPVLGDPGRPLDQTDRVSMERRLGFDFSRVRIHADDRADVSARRLDAAAYTAGSHIAFAAGQYQPSAVAGRALLAHELAHVGFGDPRVVHRSGALGFFGDIFTEGPGEALSRMFGEGTFADAELTKYLDKLRDKQQVEGDYDSDNKARAITKRWVAGDRNFPLDPRLKRLLVREMYEGTTSEGDAKAILDILERSVDPDLLAIFTIGGVSPKDLHDAFGKPERQRLVTLLDQRVKGGSASALKGGPLEFLGGAAVASQLNDESFRQRWERALVDSVELMKKAMVTDPRACDFPSSPELRFDAQNWGRDPTIQVTTPQGTMTIRDPSGKGSFVPKSGTPFEAVQSLSDNMTRWECDCLFATQIAQLFAWHAVLTPEAFNTKFAGFRTGAGQGSPTTGLEAETVSVVGEVTAAELARSLRSAPVGTIVVWHNTSKWALGTSFEHEHVIKIAHNGPNQDDLYAAHGFEGAKFGDPLTADQITRHLAEINADFPFRFAVTDQLLRDLQADDVAPYVIGQLQQHLGFEAISWLEFRKLKPVRDLMELPNPEAREQLEKLRRRAKLPPPDAKAAQSYVDNTIVLDRVEIPK